MSGLEIRRQMRKKMHTNNYSELTDRVTTRYRNYRRTQQRRKLREDL